MACELLPLRAMNLAAPLEAFGPIVWAFTSLAVLLIAVHLTRTAPDASDATSSEPPASEAA